ncbi:glycosyltransferase [Thermosediminibacter oceani]|uniref:Glycosyl transferase family 2 n=1 Tax=Thermosediminibacter oceani (strain ATCC BAA-1034 / DSM 16646 / JW/IW-1228P) TaxID=555079 RepID=D9RYA4_THEOJ|nr:glycosyltransferase [Thermosediminibacter oceani]ADL08328.1 glycosyl transferase family 2 [Thermosediminibacter oceani DSM 16646]
MNDLELKKKRFKELIEELINDGDLESAEKYLNEYEKSITGDADVYSMKGIIRFIEGKYDEAERYFKKGLLLEYNNVDLLYNLAKLKMHLNDGGTALKYLVRALFYSSEDELKREIRDLISTLKGDNEMEIPKKIVFFVKPGLDNFINDIIMGLTDEYETRKVIVNNLKQIDEGMEWADICWFEWCDELVIYGSKHLLAEKKKVICRLHSYEAFTDYPAKVNWANVDKVIFVAKHIYDIVAKRFSGIKEKGKSIVINNGIDLNKFTFKNRCKGFDVAYVGYINYKKGPMLLLQLIKALVDIDKRYKLHIAGVFQDERYKLYYKQMIEEMGIKDNVIFYGWVDDIDKWLEDKNYIVSTSVLEGHPYSVMEAMAKGIKPVIHCFVGAKDIFENRYLWTTINTAVEMVLSNEYNSLEYRRFIEGNYSLEIQIKKIRELLNSLGNMIEINSITSKQTTQVKSVWDKIWSHYKSEGPVKIANEPGGMVLRSEFIDLLNNFFVLKSAKILEVGCGGGQFSLEFCLRNAFYEGIDLSKDAIDLARKLSSFYSLKNCNFKLGDGFDLSYPNGQFDIVFNMDVIEHFTDDDIIKMLKEMARAGKYVVIGVPYSGSKIYSVAKKFSQKTGTWEYGYERDFHTLGHLFEKAGLKLLYEDVIGYQSECQYLKRINLGAYEVALGENIARLFLSDNEKIGSWLISIGTLSEQYSEIFNKARQLKGRVEFSKGVKVREGKNPSVSIIIPFYNGSEYVAGLVENLSQIEYDNFEVVFVNDGSEENTEEILKKEMSAIKNINTTFIRFDDNRGQFFSRLEGIKHSSGEYVFFHDMDDIIYRKGFKKLINDMGNFSNSDSIHIPVSCALMDENGYNGQIWYHSILPSAADYLVEEVLSLCGKVSIINTLFKKEMLIQYYEELSTLLGGIIKKEKIKVGEDTVVFDFLAMRGAIYRILPVYYTLRGYRFSRQSFSRNLHYRLNGIPLTIAFNINYLLGEKLIDNHFENTVKEKVLSTYGSEMGNIFLTNYERYREMLKNIII